MVRERFNILTPPWFKRSVNLFSQFEFWSVCHASNNYHRRHENPRFQLHHHYVIMLRHYKLNRWICDAEEREFERGCYGLIRLIYWQV